MQNNYTDRDIFEYIRTQALADAPEPDFEDIKRRIAELPQKTDRNDGLGYRDMFPAAEKKPSMIRYAAAAAAVIAAVGIGAAALRTPHSNSTTSDASYSAEMAYEEDAASPEWDQEAADEDIAAYADMIAEENAEPAYEETPAETSAAISVPDGDASDDNAFDGATTTTDGSHYETEEQPPADSENINAYSETSEAPLAPAPNSTALSEEDEELYDFYIKELGITLGVPYQAFCTGPDVSDSFPPLERFGMTAEQLESNYKSRGICFNAVWYDEDGADVIEIVVSSEDVSDTINNLSTLSEYEMEQLRQSYLRYGIDSPDSPRYYDVSVVHIKGQPYIRALGKDYAGKACHAQYMTIVNGRRVKLSLIEHYGSSEAMPEEGVSPAHTALMDNVAASVRYDRIRGEFAYRISRLRPTAWVSLLGIVILIAYGVHYLIERRKHPLPEDEQPDEGPAAYEADWDEQSGEELSEEEPPGAEPPDEELPEEGPSSDEMSSDGGDPGSGDPEEKDQTII